MAWHLVPALVSLRNEFDQLAPSRDRASDGSIGDSAHKASTSDHNIDDGPNQGSTPSEDADSLPEVHAIDVDRDLRKSGWTMDRAVKIIVDRHRAGKDDRLQNVIWNRRIASRSWGWTWRAYTGSNPHDKHAHFSARYTTAAESDRSPWGLLEEDGMDVNDDVIVNDINPGKPGEPGYNEHMTVGWALRYATHATLALQEARALTQKVDSLRALCVSGFQASAARDAVDTGRDESTAAALGQLLQAVHQGYVDPGSLAAMLAPELAARLADHLPEQTGQLTRADVEGALRSVLVAGVGDQG